jgi:Domain of unknown function (DUF4349)/Putative zinc-finger
MRNTTHPVAPEEVMALLDGELSAADAQSVSMHMEQCAACTAVAAQLRATSQEFVTWTVAATAFSLESMVLRAAKGGPASEQGWLVGDSTLHWPFSIPARWGLGAIAIAILIAFGISSGRMVSHKTISYPMKAQSEALDATRVEISPYVRRLPTDADEAGGGGGDTVRSSMVTPPPPMIARTVALTVVVQDFAVARAALDAILERHHSYAAELTVNTAEGAPRSLQASLRVPATDLSAALSELKLLGRVENESQSGEEVTQQHADLVARLKNSRETEQRLQAILQQRTGKISDVLQVEQEIARVRGEIEQMEAEQKSLEHRVDFATINFTLGDVYKAQLTSPTPSFGNRLHNGLVAGYRNAAETLFNIVLFFIVDGPVLLIWMMLLGLPIFFMWRRYRRSLSRI